MIISKVSRSLVACNVYISAGGHPNHRDILLGLLGETQELCRLANKNENENNPRPPALDQRIVVVHAFRDGPYDRSSLHLAGSPDLVADVGSSLAVRVIQALMRFETTNNVNTATERLKNSEDSNGIEKEENEPIGRRHPTVGLVDHVSVLSLDENNRSNNDNINNNDNVNVNVNNSNNNNKHNEIASIAGSVARDIGETLKASGADVHYYGHAHPSGKELAAVRRESTRFFENANSNNKTVGATDDDTNNSNNKISNMAGQATVGVPHRFVENFNIRLKPGISRTVARTLTESVRERSGRGLPFVEALTLAYGHDQYEVACNLLDPSVTSTRDVEERMREWEQQQQQQDDDVSGLVETAYRVGTTTDMCLKALRKVSTEEREMAYNKHVFERLEEDFLSG